MPGKPTALIFAGHDPTGGAGVQADVETLASLGCVATSIITCLTAQNTRTCDALRPQTPQDFSAQTALLLEDVTVSACKIGAVGGAELLREIHRFIAAADFPVVIDPVLQTATGHDFAAPGDVELLRQLLFPRAAVVTPNRAEALRLSGADNVAAAGPALLASGCQAALITDAEDSDTHCVNLLFHADGRQRRYARERLPGGYHGSGCTLSAAITAGLAQGLELETAVEKAQTYTWHSLKHAVRVGRGQLHPNRFFNGGVN